jgi:DNA-binding SARP family transcriptional activator
MSGDLRRDSEPLPAGPSGGFQLQLLGDFSLLHDQTRISLPTGPQRLLAFLAISGPAPRSQVVGTLWPEISETHARGSLRTAMWRLQRAVPSFLRATGDVLGLNPETFVDVRAVAESARAILQDASRVSVGQAVLRIQGELLPGWYDDWVIFERERVRQLRLHALDALAERFTAQGRYVDALEAAIESTRIEPLRESSNRVVIAIHLAESNAAEALRHYQFFRDLLRNELGLEPSARLTAMLPAAALQALAGR